MFVAVYLCAILDGDAGELLGHVGDDQSAEKSFDFRLEFDDARKQTVRLCLPSRHTVKSQAATPTVFRVSLIRPTT